LTLTSTIHIILCKKNYFKQPGGAVSKKLFTIILILGLSASQIFASGFQINEQGARAMGMGGAFVGLADDPSAVYFNPAGITQLPGLRFSLGATYIQPNSTFTGPSPSTAESKLNNKFFYPANFYATYEAGSDLWIGFAFNSPFGLGTEWADNWVGKYRTTNTEIRTFNFSPTVAYKINNELSVAAGVTVSYADVTIAKMLPLALRLNPADPSQVTILPDADLELNGNATSIGASAGILYKPMKELSLGLSFHSPIKYDFKGDATTTLGAGTPAPYVPTLSKMVPSGNITAPLTVPMVITLGAAYHISEALLLSGDFQYNAWSSYDQLTITFESWKDPTSGSNISTSTRDYKNSFIARLGGEYIINESLTGRLGVLYDKNPVQDARLDPTLPDADRIGLNIGVGYKLTEKLSVDLAYFYLIFKERTINNSQEAIVLPNYSSSMLNGTYSSSAHLIGLNLSYSL
jgi:long-chain fatty acid transport protein